MFFGRSSFFIFVFAFMSLDGSLSNQESILACLLSFLLIIKIYHYYYGCIALKYNDITKLHYSKLFYLIMSLLFIFSIVFIVLFLFPFSSSISFTFIFQILFDLALHLLFYLIFVLLYLLSFSSLFIPRNLLSQECGIKSNSFIRFFARLI